MADTPFPDYAKLLRWDPPDPASDAAMAGGLAKMIGALVIYYAMIEHWIDGMVFCIHSLAPGAKEIEKRHPFHAAKEKEFLAECLTTLPELSRFKDEGIALLGKLGPLSEYRNHIIHGHVRNFNFDEGWMEFSRVVPDDKKQPVRESLKTTAEGLYNKGIEMKVLIPEFREFMQRLLIAFDPTYAREQPTGSLGWTLTSLLPIVKKIGD